MDTSIGPQGSESPDVRFQEERCLSFGENYSSDARLTNLDLCDVRGSVPASTEVI